MGEAVLAPGGQTFEAVDELEGTLGCGNDTEGQGRGVVGRTGGSTGAERSVVGTQFLDGNKGDSARHMVWKWRTGWSRRNLTEGLGHRDFWCSQKGSWPPAAADQEER